MNVNILLDLYTDYLLVTPSYSTATGLSLVTDNISGDKGQFFFPLVFTLFFFIVSLNLIGLVPYSFTLTSHLVVTFSLSIAIFIGINIICVRLHGFEIFSLFLSSSKIITKEGYSPAHSSMRCAS